MDIKDSLLNNANSIPDESDFPKIESEPALTSLEFEFFDGSEASADGDAAPAAEPSATASVSVEVASETAGDKEGASAAVEEEFLIPDTFDADDPGYTSDTFIETPSNLRTTYLPRFTDVSDNYRMQNDPRPRPSAPSSSVTAEPVITAPSNDDLDPTSEKLDDGRIERVLVRSGTPIKNDLVDESVTVLKFSLPEGEDDEEEHDPIPAAGQPPVFEPEEETPEAEAEPDPEEIPEEIPEATERPKNTTVPDPDTEYRVVSFTDDTYHDEEPETSYDNGKGSVRGEFTAVAQRDAVKDRFLDSLMSIKVRLAGIVILLAAILGMELAAAFGKDATAWLGLGSVPSARAFIDLQLAICFFIFTIPETVKAVKLLFEKRATPELYATASLIAVAVNDIVLMTRSDSGYLTLGLLYGIQCLGIIASSYVKTAADFSAFRVISKNGSKNVLDKKFTRDLPRENKAVDGAVDEYSSKTARMFRTSFVSDFFKRSSDNTENGFNTLIILGVAAGISICTGLASFFLNGYSAVSAVQSFATVFLMSLPVFSILLHKLPYGYISRETEEEQGAFVGEKSLYECADIDVVTYDDTEIFGPDDVSIAKVHHYGKAYNMTKSMRQMYSIFSAVGGPLDYVFSSSLDRKCPSASGIVIEDDGISGSFEGHTICAGTEAYMLRHGVAIPADDYRTNRSAGDTTGIMYGAEDGEVYVKFFIAYSFSEEFTMLLPELKEKKITPLIYTRDPNITGELIKALTLGEDTMRVMKKYTLKATELKAYRSISSGMVTHGNKLDLVNMVLLSKTYTEFQESFASTELVAMLSGAALSVVLSIGDMLDVSPAVLAIWQLIWLVLFIVRSRLSFGHKNVEDTSYHSEDTD